MANFAQGAGGGWVGIGQSGQSAWRDASGVSYLYYPMYPGGPEKKEETVFSGQARGGGAIFGRSGLVSVDGNLVLDWYPKGLVPILNNIFSRSSRQAECITISASNRKIDFVDTGGTKAATLTTGLYTPALLAVHIASVMTAASANTISASFSDSTKKYTLSSNGGTFQLLSNTGANLANAVWATLGYSTASNHTGSTSYVSDTATASVYIHTFTIPPDLALPHQYGIPLLFGLDTDVMEVLSATFTGLQFAVQNNFLVTTATLLAPERTFGSASPTFGSSIPMLISGNMTVDITTPDDTWENVAVRQLGLNFPAPARLDYSDLNVFAKKVARTEKMIPEVTHGWDYSDEDLVESLKAAWDDKDPVSMMITLTGDDLGSGALETLQFEFPYLHRVGADPKVGGAGPIPFTNSWKAAHDHENDASAVTITVTDTVYYA